MGKEHVLRVLVSNRTGGFFLSRARLDLPVFLVEWPSLQASKFFSSRVRGLVSNGSRNRITVPVQVFSLARARPCLGECPSTPRPPPTLHPPFGFFNQGIKLSPKDATKRDELLKLSRRVRKASPGHDDGDLHVFLRRNSRLIWMPLATHGTASQSKRVTCLCHETKKRA